MDSKSGTGIRPGSSADPATLTPQTAARRTTLKMSCSDSRAADDEGANRRGRIDLLQLRDGAKGFSIHGFARSLRKLSRVRRASRHPTSAAANSARLSECTARVLANVEGVKIEVESLDVAQQRIDHQFHQRLP